MAGKILTARNAQINTAVVTVKSLTIEGKQVTLALFRQLLEENIFDGNPVMLKGIGWGHVRYLVDSSHDRVINLVWQKGRELRRCLIVRKVDRSWYRRVPELRWDRGYDGVHRVKLEFPMEFNAEFKVDETLFKVDETLDWETRRKEIQARQTAIEARFRGQHQAFQALNERRDDERDALAASLFDLPQLFIAT